MKPDVALRDLERRGYKPLLELALQRYKRDLTLGRVSQTLDSSDRALLTGLYGYAVRGLDLREFDSALRSSRFEVSLVELLEALHGQPIQSSRQQRDALEERWDALLEQVSDEEWRAALIENGSRVLRREFRNTEFRNALALEPTLLLELVSCALAALRRGAVALPVLATSVAGNAHALDPDTTAGALLLEACAALELEPPLRNGVSSHALIANLPMFAGACLRLPLRTVLGLSAVHCDALLLENPAVFEALLTAGVTQPMICTDGQPSASCMALLKKLTGRLRLSVDFDLGGLRIAQRVEKAFPARVTPWLFGADAYRVALERSGGFALSADLLEPHALHHPALVRAMQATARGAHQEALLPELIKAALEPIGAPLEGWGG